MVATKDFSEATMRDLVRSIKSLESTIGRAIGKAANATAKESKKTRESSEARAYFWINATCLVLYSAVDVSATLWQGYQTSTWSTDPLGSAAAMVGGTSGIFEKPIEEGATIAGYPVTSGYGLRDAPVAGASSDHKGVDLGTPTGTQLFMIGSGGTVECWNQPGGAGNVADITVEGSEYTFQALHLDKCQSGQFSAGQVFATTGATGIGTGAHLDWRQKLNGEHVHPTEGWLWWALTGNPPENPDAVTGAEIAADSGDVIHGILKAALEVGASENDLVIAIATCLVESNCTTGESVRGVDADSIGAFQQRPSMEWPNSEDPYTQARAFFTGSGSNIGLLDIPEGERRSNPGASAQKVQRSAHPERYDERMEEARRMAAEVLGK